MVMAKQGKIVYHTRNTTTKATAAGLFCCRRRKGRFRK
nr:MAG TPA: hypothetical protein [Caudoviricetes sp.]